MGRRRRTAGEEGECFFIILLAPVLCFFKVKVDLDDEPVIISTSSTTDAKRPANVQQRYATSIYNRSQAANMAALARATKVPCTKCGNKFDTKADLEKHESAEHDEGR